MLRIFLCESELLLIFIICSIFWLPQKIRQQSWGCEFYTSFDYFVYSVYVSSSQLLQLLLASLVFAASSSPTSAVSFFTMAAAVEEVLGVDPLGEVADLQHAIDALELDEANPMVAVMTLMISLLTLQHVTSKKQHTLLMAAFRKFKIDDTVAKQYL